MSAFVLKLIKPICSFLSYHPHFSLFTQTMAPASQVSLAFPNLSPWMLYLQTTRRLYKSQNHTRRSRQIRKSKAAIKSRCGLPRRIDDKSPRAGKLRNL